MPFPLPTAKACAAWSIWRWPAFPEPDEDEENPTAIRVAIVGRPNVGKSTLINTLLGEERVIAFDAPGTTRDSIEIDFERGGRKYVLIDTAGMRKRGKVFETIEKFSVVKTLQSIEDANVVILMVDAQADFSIRMPISLTSSCNPDGRWSSRLISGMVLMPTRANKRA
jgi:predicted GTPase